MSNVFSDPAINQWSHPLSLLSPLACFLSSGLPLLHFFEVLPQNIPCCRKDNSLPLLLYKMSSRSLHFIGLGTYCLRNLAGPDHRNKHGKVRKLPEFSSCWFLVLYSFQKRKWKIRGFLIEDVAHLPKSLLHKYKQFSGSTKIYLPLLLPW